MEPMAGMAGMRPGFGALLIMWWVMMAAMMLPSAIPAVLLYARVRAARDDGSVASSWLFLSGYVLAWLGFSVVAALVTQFLDQQMAVGNRYAEAALLIAAGAFQLSPLKGACLTQCRSPAQFISRPWRPGGWGAVRLGLLHGLYCIGCCWMLMALLFVGGVMNLAWVVALAILVAAEKLTPLGPLLARLSGVALIAWGVVLLVR